MCLIAFALDASPRWALVLAANRDEWHSRPAAPLTFWPDAPQLAAGRDLQAGGTWMGLTRDGRFAALTNAREPGVPPPPSARSRGELVAGYLAGEDSADAAAHARAVHAAGSRYAGFHLVLGDLRCAAPWWRTGNRTASPLQLGPGLHALSNGAAANEDQEWPKVRHLRGALADALALERDDACALSESDALLMRALACDAPPPDHELPDTGVGLERERQLGAAFVRAPGYGTRVSTLLRVGRDGRVRLIERTWPSRAGAAARERRIELALADPAIGPTIGR